MNIPEGWKLVPVADLIRWRDAFHTELVEWDIDPPLHHVKSSYDEICALLAALTPPAQQCRADGRCQYAIDSGAEGDGHCPPGKCVMPAQQDADALTVLRELVEARDAFNAASSALQLQETSLRLRRATVEARALLAKRGEA